MSNLETIEAHEQQDATDTDVSTDHLLVESLHDLESPCWYVYTTHLLWRILQQLASSCSS